MPWVKQLLIFWGRPEEIPGKEKSALPLVGLKLATFGQEYRWPLPPQPIIADVEINL